MSFGARIINQSGFAQVDQDYSNYAVFQSGTVSVTTGQIATISYSSDGAIPVLFAKFSSQNSYLMCPSIGLSSTNLAISGEAGTYSVPYMLCRPASSVPPQGDQVGLAISRSDGQRAFDSRLMYPRVSQIVTTPQILDIANTTETITFANAIPNRWICVSAMTGLRGIVSPSIQGFFVALAAATINSTQIRLALRIYGAGPAGVNKLNGRPATILDILNP